MDGRSDFNGYQNIYEEYPDDSNLSQFQRGTARKSLKSDHLDKWIDMQESYAGVIFSFNHDLLLDI